MAKTRELFLDDGCIQLGWVKLGLRNYDTDAPIHKICTDDNVMFTVKNKINISLSPPPNRPAYSNSFFLQYFT